MTDDQHWLPSGNRIELYEPPASGTGGMQSGNCPGCRNGLNGYLGRCAAIRELNELEEPIHGQYTTSYGHFDCMSPLFDRVVAHLDEPVADQVVIWTYDTQREMILYVQRRGAEGKSCVVQFDPNAGRERRYRFRTNHQETE
jgi:hypothetical protein